MRDGSSSNFANARGVFNVDGYPKGGDDPAAAATANEFEPPLGVRDLARSRTHCHNESWCWSPDMETNNASRVNALFCKDSSRLAR